MHLAASWTARALARPGASSIIPSDDGGVHFRSLKRACATGQTGARLRGTGLTNGRKLRAPQSSVAFPVLSVRMDERSAGHNHFTPAARDDPSSADDEGVAASPEVSRRRAAHMR